MSGDAGGIPAGMEAEAVLATIEKVVSALAPGFVFGYFTVEDIRQQGRLYALDALKRYDGKRTLENFLYKHVKNRLINYKRDKYHRADPPCKLCERAYPGPSLHEDGEYCERFMEWKERNARKQCLARTMKRGADYEILAKISRHDGRKDNAGWVEMEEKIDGRLPYYLRADYLRMREGVSVPTERRVEVRRAVARILGETYAED
jgi:DNA-directed RNA polymerase specialized sigma24 family protein